MKVSAAQAAELVDRHERIVRGWILSNQLVAEQNPSTGKYEIAIEDLLALM
jgi:hypothetical protein